MCEYQILVNFLCLGVFVSPSVASSNPWRHGHHGHHDTVLYAGYTNHVVPKLGDQSNRSCYLSQLHRSSLLNGRTLIKKNMVYSLHLSTLGRQSKDFAGNLRRPHR